MLGTGKLLEVATSVRGTECLFEIIWLGKCPLWYPQDLSLTCPLILNSVT